MDPIEPEACDEPVALPPHEDRLRASWTNVEDYRQRQLVLFADSDQARAYADRVLDLYRSCPSEGDRDEGRLTTVTPTDLGESGAVARTTYLLQGYPAVGQTTTHVVRVGTAVLLSVTSNEGGAGPHPEQEAAEEIAETGREIADVVDAMKIFTPKSR